MPNVLRLFGPTRKVKDIKGQAKVSKQCHGCHGLLIFVETLSALNNWFTLKSKSVHYHGNLISKSCKPRVMRL